nr:uncharacterized protein LOC129397238 [Pan paniscus]
MTTAPETREAAAIRRELWEAGGQEETGVQGQTSGARGGRVEGESRRPAARQPPLELCRPHPSGVWEAAGPQPARGHVGRGSRALIGGAGCRSREGGVDEEVQGCKEEAAAEATDGLARQALARVGLGGDGSSEKLGLQGGLPAHSYTIRLTLRSKTPPTEGGVRTSAPLPRVTPGRECGPWLGGVSPSWRWWGRRCQRSGSSRAERGESARERASCWRPALQRAGARRLGCRGMQAGNVAAERPGTFL